MARYTKTTKEINMSRIGIFWIRNQFVLPFLDDPNQISSINGFKDSDKGHNEYWEEARLSLNAMGEYFETERGRVLLNTKTQTFIVYCSTEISNDPPSREVILKAFALVAEQAEFRIDEHYEIDGDPFAGDDYWA